MTKLIALAIGMTGTFYSNGQSAGQSAEITRIWSETCVNIKITSGAGFGAPDPTSVFVPPLDTPADRHPAGYYFLPDAFVAAAKTAPYVKEAAADLSALRVKLKSGEYDGADIMAAWIAIDELIARRQAEAAPSGTEGVVAAKPDRPLSFGERAVGLQFNPSNQTAVYQCKSKFAALIDQLEARRQSTTDGEVKRLCSIAITEAQTAQMWAVKALTWES